jgi:hypothetical protein
MTFTSPLTACSTSQQRASSATYAFASGLCQKVGWFPSIQIT